MVKKPTAYMNVCKALWPLRVRPTGKKQPGVTGRLVREYEILDKVVGRFEIVGHAAGIDGLWKFERDRRAL